MIPMSLPPWSDATGRGKEHKKRNSIFRAFAFSVRTLRDINHDRSRSNSRSRSRVVFLPPSSQLIPNHTVHTLHNKTHLAL